MYLRKTLTTRLLWCYVDNNYICMKIDIKMKINSNSAYSGKVRGTVSDKVIDRSNDPYFVKKAKEAAEDIRKYGFPEEVLKILKEQK